MMAWLGFRVFYISSVRYKRRLEAIIHFLPPLLYLKDNMIIRALSLNLLCQQDTGLSGIAEDEDGHSQESTHRFS